MNQEITCSSSIIDFFLQPLSLFKPTEHKRCLDILEQNSWVFDDRLDLAKEYFRVLEEHANNEDKSLLNGVISQKINSPSRRLCNIESSPLDKSSETLEIMVSSSSKDKILFHPNKAPLEEEKTQSKYIDLGIEIHTQKTLVNPGSYHRLKNIPQTIHLKRDVIYKLEELLEPYYRNAEEMRIEDAYLPNELSVINLEKIMSSMSSEQLKGICFSFVTLSKQKYCEANKDQEKGMQIYSQFEKFINKYQNKKVRIDLITHGVEREHTERHIILKQKRTIGTHQVVSIRLPSSLDFLRSDGTVKKKSRETTDWSIEIAWKD
jgi:hypothetical protein